ARLRGGDKLTVLGGQHAGDTEAMPDLWASVRVLEAVQARGADVQPSLWRATPAARGALSTRGSPDQLCLQDLPRMRETIRSPTRPQTGPVLWKVLCGDGEMEVCGISLQDVDCDVEQECQATACGSGADAPAQSGRADSGQVVGEASWSPVLGPAWRQWPNHDPTREGVPSIRRREERLG